MSEDVRPGRFYLFPKIHKQGCPGRPLVPEKINSYIKDANDFLHKLETNWRVTRGSDIVYYRGFWVIPLHSAQLGF